MFEQLTAYQQHAQADGDAAVERTVRAHLAYLGSVRGKRPELDDYMRATQGCGTAGWSEEYILELAERARQALAGHGIGWNARTGEELHQLYGPITLDEAGERVGEEAAKVEPIVRELTGTTAPFTVKIEVVDVDDYWSFWVDGAGTAARLRFNKRTASFTETRLRSFAQHELLGHALQCSSFSQTGTTEDVPWVRTLTTYLPYQSLLEGLATVWPMFTTPDDERLMTYQRVTHYTHLVRAELHRAINAGHSVSECADHARARVPWMSAHEIGNLLSDRGTEPMLRSYLWSYPAGTDWFMNLAEQADAATIDTVLRTAYHHPLTPADLAELWPTGPAIGGDGAPITLRRPTTF
ncbi:hypothetical protein Kisp01_50410 [Kineosporia sp. NBRC 101677]|uniref:hypothetical protein n=1 Tax=Kineosporia sp. NBRC 101677 TaxID=3032197 RepID=UPI0024A5433F|nr:hypothetical protein [Kineosporia sp. NBRC 101677]GLY18027.1 hypothetical protein Kisp01_50410 [Kineosporia sp. NBRC 101677]